MYIAGNFYEEKSELESNRNLKLDSLREAGMMYGNLIKNCFASEYQEDAQSRITELRQKLAQLQS
jgi:outer membrane protein assembly factor BamD (BamD/ComL family)